MLTLSLLVRLLAMPLPTVMFYFGFVHLTLDFLRARGFQAPFRISSTPKGYVMPTALYVLIEDVVAVDGGGGQVYRRALRDRYLSSPYFRQMLFEMNCFWGGGSVIFAAIITALIFTTPRDVAYTVCLSPLVGLWFLVLIFTSLDGLYLSYGQELGSLSLSHGSRPICARRKLHGGKYSVHGIPYTDDITCARPQTRFISASGRLMSSLPFQKPGKPTIVDNNNAAPVYNTETVWLPHDLRKCLGVLRYWHHFGGFHLDLFHFAIIHYSLLYVR